MFTILMTCLFINDILADRSLCDVVAATDITQLQIIDFLKKNIIFVRKCCHFLTVYVQFRAT